MSQFYGGGQVTVELAKVRARAYAVTDNGLEEKEDFELVRKLPMFSAPVLSSTSSSFL